jgi:hypothetical protein
MRKKEPSGGLVDEKEGVSGSLPRPRYSTVEKLRSLTVEEH